MSARQPRFNSLFSRLLVGACLPLLLFAAVVLVASTVLYQWLRAQAGEQRSNQVIVLSYKQQYHLRQMTEAAQRLSQSDSAARGSYDAHRREFLDDNTHAEQLLRPEGEQSQRLADLRDREEQWHKLLTQEPAPADRAARSQALADQLQDEVAAVIHAEEARLDQRRARAAELTVESFWTIGVILGLSVLITVLFVRRFALSVTGPIDRLRTAANELLAGRHLLVPPSGPNEIAQLMVHFNHLGLSLMERTSSLESQREGYQQYLGATSQLLWRTSADGAFDPALPSWQQYTGLSDEALRADGWLDAVHPDDRVRAVGAWKQALASRTLFEAECRLRAADDSYRDFSCRAVPILNADGSVREWIGTCADVTERAEKARLQQEKEAAESASKTKTEFVTKMSHELRTPLNAVIGMSKMLSTQRFGPLTAKQADYVADITQAGEHLLLLINDILDLAKVEAGRMEFQADRFPVNAALAAVVATLRPLADFKGLTLRLEPATDGALATDPARLKQVLYNLLSNAIKFTPANGSVTVTCQWVSAAERRAAPAAESAAAAIRVEVRDTGVGIAAEDQPRIWDEFYQLPSSHPQTAGNEGTGLGLALTRHLVRRLGGTIWVESALGAGSTFGFAIPRTLPPEGLAEEPANGESRPLVLVVEDHPPTHKLLVDWLTGAGLRTASAYDGEAGLALAREKRPQLVVLDIKLPKLDGWQVLTELKHDPATAAIPVAVVTVSENVYPTESLGVQEFFVKPVNGEEFVRRLKMVRPALFGHRERPRVLVVDAEPTSRAELRQLFEAQGLKAEEASDGRTALARLAESLPDLVVLDPLLPHLDGFAVVEAIRENPAWERLPVLIVTARDLTADERQRLTGRIQALLTKQRLTADKLSRQLHDLGLVAGVPAGSG